MSENEPEKPPELPMPPGVGVAYQPELEPPLSDLLCRHGEDGRCKWFWEFQTNFEHSNAPGSLDHVPKINRRICRRGREEMDLSGMAVYSCNEYKGTNPKKGG